ncbi:MAG: hypothetical protein QF521_25325 [Alphaproteobacteria bacterium]|nr:hypothetical protein [Alphaproteobacteria bacterium]
MAVGPRRFQGTWHGIGTIVLDFEIDAQGAVTGGSVNLLLRDRAYEKIG